MRISTRRVVAVFVTTALVLASCSGDDDASSDEPETTPATTVVDDEPEESDTEPAPTTTISESSVVDVVVPPGTSDDGFEGARSDVEELNCEMVDDAWVASGDVTNPLDVAVSYRIYVSFRDADRDRGLIEVNVDEVEPGETREWEGTLDVSVPDLECILRVERTRPEA